MAFRLEATIQRWRGDSSDEKPRAGDLVEGEETQQIRQGSELIEEDTGREYRWDGSRWILQEKTIAALIAVSESIRDSIQELLPHIRVTRAAVVALANDQCGSDFPSDDK